MIHTKVFWLQTANKQIKVDAKASRGSKANSANELNFLETQTYRTISNYSQTFAAETKDHWSIWQGDQNV